MANRVHGYKVPVSFIDVAKHAPEGVRLSVLGELLGLPKLELPDGYSISRMDELLAGNRQAFIKYAIRDSEIAAKYYIKVLQFARKEIWTVNSENTDETTKQERKLLPVSAGALAVQLCKATFKGNDLEFDELFGVTETTTTKWNSVKNRMFTIKSLKQNGMRRFHENFVIEFFHGGRNETFYVGPSLPGIWHDYDLKGAYTTGMALIRPINYAESHESKNVEDFMGDVMGFAWVDFKYPDHIRYTSLPVRSGPRGLLYPRMGESYATAPEIALAVDQGATVNIKRGVIYPWSDPDGPRIFVPFVRKIHTSRSAYPKGSVFEQTAKLHGNSIFGKTGQGLKDKNAFDTETMESKRIPHSALTNAPIAALTTGFIRAVMGEILHRLPYHRTVISVTTDGILTDAEPDELDLSGPLCQRYLQLCAMVQS